MITKEKITDFIVITLAAISVAISIYFFLLPSKVSVGGVSSIAQIVSYLVPLSVSTLSMMMNAILLVIGFVLIGKEFGIKTVYSALLIPTTLAVLERICPNNSSILNDQFLDAITYIGFSSVGMAILFKRNASSGGLDIVGKIMNKYLHMELGRAIGLCGIAVALSSAFVFDKKTVVLSVICTYISGVVLDHFIFGSTIKRKVCILSRKQEEILDFILNELHSGATKYHSYGAYSDEQHVEIVAIVDKHEYGKLMTFIQKTDPDAFVTIYAVNEMMYKPKVIGK
ncbi:MAG: YitT family protein [Erysipelotrichales bacterium]|nr:YitT family protein [Erysipelotrichales bacterium]